MSTSNIQVVVAYDFSPSSEVALMRAIDVAARAPQHVLHIVTAIDKHDTYDDAERTQSVILEGVTNIFMQRETASEVQFYVHARLGKPAVEILAVAEEVGADLIFIGAHNRTNIKRLLLGSVSEQVVREAQCPVMVARSKTYKDSNLMRVFPYEHARKPHREPHCYTYTNRQVIVRPDEWPLS